MRQQTYLSECFRKLAQVLAITAGTAVISACSISAKIFDGLSSTPPTAPTLLLSSTVTGPSNVSNWNVLLTSSEALSAISMTDFVLTNCTITSMSVIDSTHWNLVVTPTAEGPVSISLPASFATGTTTSIDNEASNVLSMVSDITAPQVTLGYLGTNPTNVSPLVIDVVFDEDVLQPEISDFQVTNGSVDSITGSGRVYSIEITSSSNLATVGVRYLANRTTDLAGNNNTVSNSLSIDFNSNRPLPTLSTSAGTHTNTAAITVDVSFSAAVTGFDSSDLDLTNATVSGLTGSGDTYSFTLTATAEGDFSVRVKNNAATDASSNLSSTSNLLTVRYDATVPTVTLSKTEASPTTLQAITITLTASESITGLALTDFTTTNLTLSSLSGSGSSYTLTATANAEGSISIQLPASVVADAASNANTASNTLTWYYDTAAPTITIASTQAPSTNVSPIAVTFETSEAVTGFTSSDVSVTNGTLSNFTSVDSTHWTADVTPTADGTVSISVAAGSFQDGAGKNNTAGSLSVSYDGTRPTVTLSGLSSYSTTSPLTVTATFSESVTGFTNSDLTLVNATTSMTGSGTTYTITVTPTAEGTFSVTIPAGAAADSFGNTNTASTTHSSIYDVTPPTSTITSDLGVAAFETPIPLTIRFSEIVTGLTTSDFNATGGSVTSVVGFGSVYYISFAASGPGAKSISLKASSVTDGAGWANTDTPSSSVFYYDTTITNLSITETEQVIPENDGSAKQFTVNSTVSKPYDIHLTYSTTGDAVAGFDHSLPVSGTVTLPANSTSVTVPFTVSSSASTANKYFQLNFNYADTPVARFTKNYQSRVLISDVTNPSHAEILQMSGRRRNRCAIYTGGVLKCWGYNISSSLGVGSTAANITTPTVVASADTYQNVSTGEFHTCAVTTTGNLQCWGSQSNYRIGDNVWGSYRTTPVNIGTGFSSVSTGYNYSCGIKSGQVYCWGVDVANATTTYHTTPTLINPGGSDPFTSVAMGFDSACALNSVGAVYCWGGNSYGQLGQNTTGTTKVTTPVATPTATNVTKIEINWTASGHTHACVLNTSNEIYCWGNNQYGYVGDGTQINKIAPTLISGSDSYTDISVGAQSSCGITSTSTVNCWGANSWIAGGANVTVGWLLGMGNANLGAMALTPTPISDTSTYSSIAAGETTCGVLTNGRVKCWGEYEYLGSGDNTEYTRFAPSDADMGQKYKYVSMGGFGCGITIDDQLKCWGKNVDDSGTYYSIGDDTKLFRPSPVMLDRGQTYSKVAVGKFHACAITTDRTLKCWGNNANGQLGTGLSGASYDKITPTIIDGSNQYIDVTAGNSHTCAITTTNDLKCWGASGSGQAGVGYTSTSVASPTVIASGTKFQSVKAGASHTCGITTTNDLYCWGYNSYAELGDSTYSQRNAPVAVSGGLKFKQVATSAGNGASTTCGISSADRIYCWGSNFYSTNGTGANRTTPEEITVGGTYSALAGNGVTMCAKQISNSAWYCWGTSDNSTQGTGGNGTGGNSTTPTVVYGAENYSMVGVGRNASCAVLAGGTMRCWGTSSNFPDHSVFHSWYTPIDVTNWLRP
ncbi:Ig-like domain-containing protein [Bdellovibrio sp. HCB209]|uniref:Ig-like domain-containing protein n=1 Tax=Bdellovibrio sp. HCB209 TaxID=3394354 RepID=UPI0039B3C5C1